MDFGKAPEPGTINLIIITALVTSLVVLLMNVFGKAAAEWLLNLLLRPVRFVKERVYRWIAPSNPLSISLRSYKKHVSRSNLTRIENPVGPNLDVPLEHAFAPLKLISSATQESVELFPQAASSYRCIVLGGPGTGKTTLMKSLVTSVIRGRAQEEALKDLIPVFVVLRNLAKREHTVEQAVVASFDAHHFPGAEKFVEAALSQGKLLVILDGLDEVGASREYVAGQILSFCEHDDQREQRNRLIVTCRENSYRTQDLRSAISEVVSVEPFANHHMRVFLQGWPEHKGRLAVKLYGLIQNDPQLRDICRNPLLLTILTGLYLDTDNFELPTSRERFYRAAVEELLVHRAARRQTRQTFDADDKRQILERVALERLETAARHEDPEEFTREAIARKAAEVIRQDKVDERELIKELVEVNGIIRPGSEGSYTCAHRTIQEYFAAREARRQREPREVIERFGGRPELIEVLYFYCGLLDNIPSLNFVLGTLAGEGRWLEAGRALLQMKEAPDRALVERVATELHAQINPAVEFKAHLEVLSSLAQRREPEFDAARRLFAAAVDRLAEGSGAHGASALESALATSPEAAMRVIPGLLRHQSEHWRKAAVQLLRDIGTDEALDQLVQLLNDADPFVKAEAAKVLAGMIKSRNRDLLVRAQLQPPCVDLRVWPLEAFFPGRLAIPIAEALRDSPETKSEAINYAVAAAGGRGADDLEPLGQWRDLPRDLKYWHYRLRAGKFITLGACAFVFLLFLALAAVQLRTYVRDEALVLTFSPPRARWVEARWPRQVEEAADSIIEEVKRQPDVQASTSALREENFFSRLPKLLEGNDLDLPDEKVPPLLAAKRFRNPVRSPYAKLDEAAEAAALTELASDEKVANLRASLNELAAHMPGVQGLHYVFVSGHWEVALTGFVAALYSFIFYCLVETFIRRFNSWRLKRRHVPFRFTDMFRVREAAKPVPFAFALSWYIAGSVHTSGMSEKLIILFLLVSAGGWALQKTRWPHNPLFRTIYEVAPPEKVTEMTRHYSDLAGGPVTSPDQQSG